MAIQSCNLKRKRVIKGSKISESRKEYSMGFLLPLVLFTSAVVVQEPAQTGSLATIDDLASKYTIYKCVECHEDVYEEWSQAWHAKSIIDSRVLRTWRTFIVRGLDTLPEGKRSKLKDACLRCHAPQIEDASDELTTNIADLVVIAVEDKNVKKRESAIQELSKISINCLVCHNLKGSPDGKPKEKTIYGPRKKKRSMGQEVPGRLNTGRQ
jgi:cytochrome c553